MAKKLTKSVINSPMAIVIPLLVVVVLIAIIVLTMQVMKNNADVRSRASGFAPVCAMPWVRRTADAQTIRLPGSGVIAAQTDSIFDNKLHQAIYRWDKAAGTQLYIRELPLPTDQRYNVWQDWAKPDAPNWIRISNPIATLKLEDIAKATVPSYMPNSLMIDAASDYMGERPDNSQYLYQYIWVSGLYGNFQTFQKAFWRTYNVAYKTFSPWQLATYGDLPLEVRNRKVIAMSKIPIGSTMKETLWFEGDIAAIKNTNNREDSTWTVRTRRQIGLPGTAHVVSQSDLVAPNNLYGVPRLFNSLWLENGDLWIRDFPIIDGSIANPACPIGCMSGICQ